MFASAATSSSIRYAWNRAVPRGKPFVGLFRSSVSTLSRQEVKVKPANGARLFNRQSTDLRNLGKRTYSSSSSNSGGNLVLVVGLGALGLATLAVVKTNILSIDGGPVQPTQSNAVLSNSEISVKHEETVVNEIEKETQGEDLAESQEKADSIEVLIDDVSPEGSTSQTEAEEVKEIESVEVNVSESKEPAVEAVEMKEAESQSKSNDDTVLEVEKKDARIKDLPKIPTHVPYVIIGGGTASHAACRSIRKHDPTAKILVIGDEEVLPYMRPPLSKELWFSEDEDAADTLYFKQWNGKRRSVFFEDDTYYVKPQLLPVQDNGGIAVMTGHRVTKVDPAAHKLQLKHGQEIQYDKLLIATGGQPKSIELFEKSSDDLKNNITLFRTVADYRKLDRLVRSIDSVAIVGGGFLGSELACALGSKGKASGIEVSQIYHENGNMGKVLPVYLSEWTTKKVENEGVKIYSNTKLVSAGLTEDGKVSIALNDGRKVEASHVIICAGIEPNTELASSAGLEIDPDLGGFRVNSELQARSDIWVAGDAACFYDMKLGRRRVEHHDHAVVSGRLAGENMAGGKRSYLHQSMFWSDLGPEVGYEAIGIVDNTLDTVGVWAKATRSDSPKAVVEATGENLRSQTEEEAGEGESISMVEAAPQQEELSEDFGKGVVFYLKNDTVVGMLLWNVFNKMPVARKVLKEGKKQDSLVELAKLFNIHE